MSLHLTLSGKNCLAATLARVAQTLSQREGAKVTRIGFGKKGSFGKGVFSEKFMF